MSHCGGTGFLCRTDLTDVPGTGLFFTELSEVLGTGIDGSIGTNSGTDVHTGSGTGTGIDVVLNLPKCPVPVLMSYRTYRRLRYR